MYYVVPTYMRIGILGTRSLYSLPRVWDAYSHNMINRSEHLMMYVYILYNTTILVGYFRPFTIFAVHVTPGLHVRRSCHDDRSAFMHRPGYPLGYID